MSRCAPCTPLARAVTPACTVPLFALFACLILLAAAAPQALATVDLLSPAARNATGNSTVLFEYYVSMQNLTGCQLNIGQMSFAGRDPKTSAINGIMVQDIAPGQYRWNITCTGTDAAEAPITETSQTRELTVDTQAPTLAVVSPANGTAKTLAIDIIPGDDLAQVLSCAAVWRNQTLERFNVTKDTHYAKNYTAAPGNGTLELACSDDAGNTVAQNRTLAYLPDFAITLQLERSEYGLGEPVRLVVDTLQGVNASVDVCPDQPGFVQCTTALLASTSYPQTITLPYTNRTGRYLIEGVGTLQNTVRVNQTRYNVTNSITAGITLSPEPRLNRTVKLAGSVTGGIAPYRLSWRLSNGTAISDASSIDITYRSAGNFTEQLTVTDSANNTKSFNKTVELLPQYTVAILVNDETTGEALSDVALEIDDKRERAMQGVGYYILEPGEYKVFASKEGYDYAIEEFVVDAPESVPLKLRRQAGAPQVSITAPAAGSTVGPTVPITYAVTHPLPVMCTLYRATQGNWFQPNGTLNSTSGEFTRDFAPGAHEARIECADRTGKTGSASVRFTVGAAQQAAQATQSVDVASGPGAAPATTGTTDEEVKLQELLGQFDALIEGMSAYGEQEKEIIALVGFDKGVRATKRAVQQAIRDINDLAYRNDLDETSRAAERKRIMDALQESVDSTPLGITVTDTKSFVKYVKEDEMAEVAQELAGIGGFTDDPKRLGKQLVPEQQKFTVSTKLAQIDYRYADGTTKSLTVVKRTFTYAPGVTQDYGIYEVIPKEVAKSAKELTLLTKAETLKEDPVLRFDRQESIVYLIPRKVDFTRAEDIKTVLARPMPEQGNLITGNVIFSGDGAFGMSPSLLILLGLIVLAYLAYYFNVAKQVRFLAYRLGRKEKVHYVRVLINDASDQLQGGDYDKADLLYKEVRLTYDTLGQFEKNDLFDDIMDLVHRMDEYYFTLVMRELEQRLQENDMEGAIQAYEKLTGTFERLDEARQRQLIETVTLIARRVGVPA